MNKIDWDSRILKYLQILWKQEFLEIEWKYSPTFPKADTAWHSSRNKSIVHFKQGKLKIILQVWRYQKKKIGPEDTQ